MTPDTKRRFNESLGLPDSHPFAHNLFHWFPNWTEKMPLTFDLAEFRRFHEDEGGWTLNGEKWCLTVQHMMQIIAVLSFARETMRAEPEPFVIYDTWCDMGKANLLT